MSQTRLVSGLTYADQDDAVDSWHVFANANIIKSDELMGPLGVDFAEYPSASLNVKVGAGSYRKSDSTVASYAGTSSFGLTASSTNYIYLTDAGTLSKSTSGWPAGAIVRLATAVVGTSTVTSITDARVPWASFGTGVGSYMPLGGGTFSGDVTMAAGSDFILDGAGAGSMLGTAATQKLGFWGATPIVRPSGASQAALTDSTSGDLTGYTLTACTSTGAFTDSSGGTPGSAISALAPPSAVSLVALGGTVDGSLQALTTPADTPASADALRDDLAANLVPELRNNLAELATLINYLGAQQTIQRDGLASLASAVNSLRGDLGTANTNFARLARQIGAIRTALVDSGLIKGSA